MYTAAPTELNSNQRPQPDPQITRNRSPSSLIARKPFGRPPPTSATARWESSPPIPVEASSRTVIAKSSTHLQSPPFVVEWCLKVRRKALITV
ncbi:hypothetical protein F3Y22_tig00110597pilonHSYRG00471 [Hibiscus syriacus]|uniref:Uncharacterized protein n=1 Tax=Hibiscus syriacus TaxID=106335 RepID=A0A6A3A4N4_HIBSY|nr:hypothetical protein F3Y22_tig00110597pilonHSYRG00471 [Hibiscus syriacus]